MKTVNSTRNVGLAFAAALVLLVGAPVEADDGWKVKTFGRVVYDYTAASADDADLDVTAGNLRTARLGASGSVGNLSFKLELATDSDGEVEVTDGHLDFARGDGPWSLRVGQFRTPNALDEQTSSRFTTAFERAAFTDAFELDRRLGVAALRGGQRSSLAFGVFAANVTDDANDEGSAIAARGTFLPWAEEDTYVHLGASVRYRDKGDDQPDLRYRQRPFTSGTGRILSTGGIADSDMMIGVEAAYVRGSAWAAAEFATLEADPVAGADDARFQGGYAEIGYVFGGRRTYKGGKFNRPQVDRSFSDGGLGALQLALRYDTLDLEDAGIDGGKLDTVILAADWFLTSKAHVGINVFHADADLGTSTSGVDDAYVAAIDAGLTEDTVKGAMIRLQLDF